MNLELGLVRALTTDPEFRAEFEADAEGTLTRRGVLVDKETRAALVDDVSRPNAIGSGESLVGEDASHGRQ